MPAHLWSLLNVMSSAMSQEPEAHLWFFALWTLCNQWRSQVLDLALDLFPRCYLQFDRSDFFKFSQVPCKPTKHLHFKMQTQSSQQEHTPTAIWASLPLKRMSTSYFGSEQYFDSKLPPLTPRSSILEPFSSNELNKQSLFS